MWTWYIDAWVKMNSSTAPKKWVLLTSTSSLGGCSQALPVIDIYVFHRDLCAQRSVDPPKITGFVPGRRLTDDSWGPMGWAAEEFARLGGSVKMTHRFGKTWHLEKVNWRYSGWWWAQLEKNKETTRCFFFKGKVGGDEDEATFFLVEKKNQETLPEVAFFEI